MFRLKGVAGWWLAAGLLVAVVAVVATPAGAVVTSSLVQIVGLDGSTTADVTPANQLQAAEAAPDALVHYLQNVGVRCQQIATVPTDKGLVLTQAFYDILDTGVHGLFVPPEIKVFTGPSCSGDLLNAANLRHPPERAELAPGIALPAGQSISARIVSCLRSIAFQCRLRVFLYGYFVPANAVSASSHNDGAAPLAPEDPDAGG